MLVYFAITHQKPTEGSLQNKDFYTERNFALPLSTSHNNVCLQNIVHASHESLYTHLTA